MNETIKLAIEKGGYHQPFSDNVMETIDTNLPGVSQIVLDPAFWQALGKALGWAEEMVWASDSTKDKEVLWRLAFTKNGEWLYHWHRFIDHIAEGKDVDEFFERLLSKEL